MRNTSFRITIAGIALVAACHGAPPPETPAPQPLPEVALQTHSHDSLVGARHADSVEWARQLQVAERAYFDSVEQVRLAGETAAGPATSASTVSSDELREELGIMVHFGFAEAQVLSDAQPALDRKVAILKANPTVRLQITGACDERGSDQYNVALGERRAAAVRRYLVENGIDVGRLDEASSGEKSPIDAGSDETAWARNRRAEFVIVGGDMPLAMN